MTELLAHPEFEALEGMARVLVASGHYQVLRRFRARRRYAADDGAATKTALFVDVETTGLDNTADAVIEFAAVPFVYGVASGRIYDVGEAVTYLEDPGRPIPPEITALTGITDAAVRGQRIDGGRVGRLVASASLVVAHNAAFDRPFLERRLPGFADRPWACSHAEVPWAAHGCRGTKLDYLLMKHCAEVFGGHRAAEDCQAGVHVLATPLPDGTLPFARLLASARTPTVRLWALDADFGARDALKARRYRWHPGDARRPKAWYRDLAPGYVEAEGAWLAHTAYRGRAPAWTRETYTAVERYSARV